ncbi:MAG: hypothetical protein IKU43_01020 [Clostridia bacterium]|nr:hypothetical protein [Clostridia bacterium]
MEENNKKFNWKIIAAIIVSLFMIFCVVKMGELSNTVSSLKSTISSLQNQISHINTGINSIYGNVDERLKKEASILSSVDYSLGEMNSEAHTVPVTIKVVPKSLTDDTVVSVEADGNVVILQRTGNEFSATFPVNMFITGRKYPMINITADGETKTELVESISLTALYNRYLPYIFAYIPPFDDYTDGKLTIDASLQLDVKPASSQSDVKLTKIEILTEKNGKEISRTDVTDDILGKPNVDHREYNNHIPVNTINDVEYGDEINIFVIAKDSLGYTYKINAYHWNEIDENTSSSYAVFDNSLQVYDSNGNLLTKAY